MRVRASHALPRAALLFTVAATLLAGLAAGLARLGWQMGPLSSSLRNSHGALMIAGFLGTLVALERATALSARVRWSPAVPAINAAGALALIAWPESIAGRALLTAGSLGFVALFAVMLRLHPSLDVRIMAVGALCLATGNVLWLSGWPVFRIVFAWVAFLVLTIVGERLELSRVRRLTSRHETLLVAAVVTYVGGVAALAIQHNVGIRLMGIGSLLLAAWLLRYDVAGRTITRTGLPRYIAACLLPGYVWLGVGGAIAVWKGILIAGPDYEAALHAYLVGFVFSMIFGHMPIILPALSGLRFEFNRLLYLPLILLHTTLAYRVVGNLILNHTARQWGGLLNVATILLFLALTAATVYRSNRKR